MSDNYYEFDFDVAISRLGYNNKDTFSIYEAKCLILYTQGKKLKKFDLIKQINKIRNNNENIILITKDELRTLYHLNKEEITYETLIKGLCSFYKNNDPLKTNLTLLEFTEKTKELFPNFSDELLSKIFLFLSNDKETLNLNTLINNKNIIY